jgi:hypothetical protein
MVCVLGILVKDQLIVRVWISSHTLFYFIGLSVFMQTSDLLIVKALWYVLKSGTMMFLALFFVPKVILSVQSLL